MGTDRVSATTTIDAVPEAVFAVLADPSTHDATMLLLEWWGTGD